MGVNERLNYIDEWPNLCDVLSEMAKLTGVHMNSRLNKVLSLPILGSTRTWTQEEVHHRLMEAHRTCAQLCQEHNDGLVPVCLSGGLDSTTSLALLTRIVRPNLIRAFTICQGPTHADYVHAHEAATHFDVRHLVFFPSEKEVQRTRRKAPRATLGQVGTRLLYAYMASNGVRCVLTHDGIDELLGGYWLHRATPKTAFPDFWERLLREHLDVLLPIARSVGIEPLFPYLQEDVVALLTSIPFKERTSRTQSKIPLRDLAQSLGVPTSIITRHKTGLCDVLTLNDRTRVDPSSGVV